LPLPYKWLYLQLKVQINEGTTRSLFLYMQHFEAIKQFIEDILQGTDCFVISQKSLPGNAFHFQIDADTSFDIKKCVSTTRQLRKRIEDAGLFPEGNFTMEIGSPGVDEPLQQHRQYIKNIGRLVKIDFLDAELKAVEGRLKEVTQTEINIEITDKKKKTTTAQTIQMDAIKQTIVQIEF
jgi:ribosome maturation factor RimP